MQDHIQVTVQAPNDPLAEPEQLINRSALDLLDRRIKAAQKEGADDFEALEDLAFKPRPKRFEVDSDIGELGHKEFEQEQTEKTESGNRLLSLCFLCLLLFSFLSPHALESQ